MAQPASWLRLACGTGDRELTDALVRPVVGEVNVRQQTEISDWAKRILALAPPSERRSSPFANHCQRDGWIEVRGQDHRLLAAGLAVQDQTIGISPGELEVTVHVTGLIDVAGSCWLP